VDDVAVLEQVLAEKPLNTVSAAIVRWYAWALWDLRRANAA